MKKLPAFTLIELMIVMGIVGSILAGGFAGFYSLRKTQMVEQTVLTLQDDIIEAKHLALTVPRNDNTEPWVWAVGVDLTNISNGKYTIFKIESNQVPDNTKYSPFNPSDIAWDSLPPTIIESIKSKDLPYSASIATKSNNIQYILFETITGKPIIVKSNSASNNITSPQTLVTIGNSNHIKYIKITPGASVLIETTP